MNATHDVDPILATWFAADATVRAPAGLVEAIADATATTRRRPGWLSSDRWLPVLPQMPIAVRLAALAALLLAVAIASLIVAGSRPRVPSPFGPARPGLFAMSIHGDIVTTSQDGTLHLQLTTGGAIDTNPAFSRDGTQLAYWSWSGGSGPSDLVVTNADGSGRHTIATVSFEDSGADNAIAWSPDGRSIAYFTAVAMTRPGWPRASSAVVNRSQVFIASVDGSGVRLVGAPTLMGAFPAWSPDGSLIALAAGGDDRERGLYVMHPDDTDVRRISTVYGSILVLKDRNVSATAWNNLGANFVAAWSPDGRRLAFTAGDGSTELWMVDVGGSHEHKIDEASYIGTPAWSPDGRRITWLHADGDLSRPAEHRVADADGANVKVFPLAGARQTNEAWDNGAPFVGWSADGRYVLGILTPGNGTFDRLVELDPDTGESHVIAAPGLEAWDQQRLAP